MEPSTTGTRSIEDTLVELDQLIARRRSPGGTAFSPMSTGGYAEHEAAGGGQALSPYAGAESFAGSRYDGIHRPDASISRQAGYSHNALADKVAELRMTIQGTAGPVHGGVGASGYTGTAGAGDSASQYAYGNGIAQYGAGPNGGEVRMGQGAAHRVPVGGFENRTASAGAATGPVHEASNFVDFVGYMFAMVTKSCAFEIVNHLQVVNVAVFFLNVFIVLSACTTNWYGMTWFDAKNTMQTFFTPGNTAWCIWYLTFAFQILFTLDQLRHRDSDFAQSLAGRIGWPWPLAQLIQVCWTISFCNRSVWGNWVCLFMLYPLMLFINMRLDGGRTGCLAERYVEPEKRVSISYFEWWVVYFGFQLHFAWVTHQFLMAFNIIVWAYGSAMEAHIAAAVVTVSGLVLSAFFFVYTRRDVVHAWVMSFMLYYMGQNMVDPSAMIPFAVLTSAEGDPAVYSISSVATGLSMGYYSLSGICFVFGFWALTLVTIAICYENKEEIAKNVAAVTGNSPQKQLQSSQQQQGSTNYHI